MKNRLPGSRQPERFARMVNQILPVALIGSREDQADQNAHLGDRKAGFGGAPRQKILCAMWHTDQFLGGGRIKPTLPEQNLNVRRELQD